ncbi:MAG TPA: CaiB/BaiF CoA-transferase family protein [Nitrososphaerales archaeon]|nr:CaiB/BaiF CoA-transferase family protein [Nitrososphaerales archaeon]
MKVVDATRLLPGGFCTMLLSDLGAQVVKVEQPGLGDYMRSTPPTKRGRSPVHATVNRNKLSVGIDLKKKGGKEAMTRLLKSADVFVEGFRPGAMKRLGFSFEEVVKINPRIVYCSISAYGQKSPLSSMPAHDINFQAMAGTLGYARTPAVPLLQLGDMASGMYAAVGVLAALVSAKKGVFIDVPIVASLLSWMVIPASAYLATGKAPSKGHSLVFGSTPYYNIYRTSDGKYMAVAAIEQQFWRNLVKALGVPELEDKRFGSPKERRHVQAEVARAFSSRTRDYWASHLMEKDTCATPVLSVEEALTSDWAKGASMLTRASGDTVLNSPISTRPASRGRPFTRAPELGKDTDRILRGLGYSESQVRRLRASGAVE